MVEKGRPLWALGLMSGTSMDGVDAAMVLTDGETISELGETSFSAYTAEQTALLRSGLGHWPAPGQEGIASLVEQAHVAAARPFSEAEVVGFHGQTLNHDPEAQRSFQIGDGEVLAKALARPVVWDFRTADLKSGGEGAPLAPFFHFACARAIGASRVTAFLNLGGVGNVTWVDPGKAAPEEPGALLAFDTGPGNALINDFIAARTGQAFDANGDLAAQGQVDEAAVLRFLEHSYFDRIPPKSLDRNAFEAALGLVADHSTEDGLATLTAMTSASVAASLRHMPEPPARWLVCGGGRLNRTILSGLSGRLNAPVEPVETVGLDGDMLEAQAFAYLAVRVLRGLPTSAPSTTGARLPVSGGRISRA